MQKPSTIVFQFGLSDFKARLNHEETARLLGMTDEELTIVINAPKSRLNPLGNPAQNAPKLFATREVLEFSQDQEWLDAATETIRKARLRKRERVAWNTKSSKPGATTPASEDLAG